MRQGSPVQDRRCPRNCSRRVRGNRHWLGSPGWEGAAGDDPEPGDLRIARNGTIPRAEEGPLPAFGANQSRLSPVTLVLGGARSGKSRFAEHLVEEAASCGTYGA